MSISETLRNPLTFILGFAIYWCLPPAIAHHGFGAHFDPEQYVTMDGTVTGFEFLNPHSYVYFQSADETGEMTDRWCELNAQTQLRRKGISQTSFSNGDQVRIQGFLSRNDPLGCYLASVRLADGSVLTLKNGSGNSLYSARQIEADTGIIGTWYPKGRGTAPRAGDLVTEAGQDALDAYDSATQNPVLRCEPASPLRAWVQPGTPVQISRNGGNLLIHHEFMDVRRVVHLDITDHPAGIVPTDLGHSIGRFDNSVLTIETTGFAAGVLVETAQFSVGELVLKSPYTGMNTTALKLSERLSINSDTGDLELLWTAEDPDFYTVPLTGTLSFSRTDVEVGTFDCSPAAGHAPAH
jgi:hypothetical protein